MTRTISVRLKEEMFDRLEEMLSERRKATGEAASKADIIREALEAIQSATGEKERVAKKRQNEQPVDQSQPQSRGVGVKRAHEAISVLKRIPLDDGSRQDAFSIVQDWIETNR